jgi:hypothetical protein
MHWTLQPIEVRTHTAGGQTPVQFQDLIQDDDRPES